MGHEDFVVELSGFNENHFENSHNDLEIHPNVILEEIGLRERPLRQVNP